jgi:hypothetical protein
LSSGSGRDNKEGVGNWKGDELMDIKLPRLGEGADSGTVVSIFVKLGDQVEE